MPGLSICFSLIPPGPKHAPTRRKINKQTNKQTSKQQLQQQQYYWQATKIHFPDPAIPRKTFTYILQNGDNLNLLQMPRLEKGQTMKWLPKLWYNDTIFDVACSVTRFLNNCICIVVLCPFISNVPLMYVANYHCTIT